MVQYRYLSTLLLAAFATAQTFTDCDPLKASCPSNPGLLAKSLTVNFAETKSLPSEWETVNQGTVKYEADGAKLVVAKPNDSLNIISKFYVLFGSFEFKVKAAPGSGLVSTVVLLSDARDEIDWEILAKEPDQAQSNYFGKGDDAVFDRGGTHPAPNNQKTWYTYRLDWTPDYVTWSIDGKALRTLKYTDAKGGSRFPQTPMRIRINAWAAGDPSTNREGTVSWAGGPVNWQAGPYTMAVESVNIVNYTPAKEFIYSDKSGSYQSIKIVDGSLMSNGAGAPPAAKPVDPTTVAPPPPPISQPTANPTPKASTSDPVTIKPASIVSTTMTSSVGSASSVSSVSSTSSSSRPLSTVSSNVTQLSPSPAVVSTNSAVGTLAVSGSAALAVLLSMLILA